MRRRPRAENPVLLRVRLLGGFQVWVGPRAIEEGAWRLRKAKTLLKLLALAPGHRLHRERVADLLWPDAEPAAANNSLHQILHHARQVLGSGSEGPPSRSYLELRGDLLVLCPDVPIEVDVDAFEAAGVCARQTRDPAEYRAALALYAGDLLPEDRYEDWAKTRCEQLRALFLSLLRELADLHAALGERAEAIQMLERLVAAEPSLEGASAELMRLYAESGRRAEALRVYHQLEDTLRRELDAVPASETRLVREAIVAGHDAKRAERERLGAQEDGPHVATPTNLSIVQTSFIGRERELAELLPMLASTRLLTLTGAGGAGKSRLALELARRQLALFPDGVWVVELASMADARLVGQVAAGVLRVRDEGSRTPAEALARTIGARRVLLVLDNCEHVASGVAALVPGLLASCPGLRVLTTSRRLLDITGELVWRVPSMAAPDPAEGPLPAPQRLLVYDAVRLFVARARRSRAGFALTPENAAAVAVICARLGGIPLAIELAAARMGVLSAQQVAERLDDAFAVLARHPRSALPRHRTMRAALDWSHGLLDEPARALLRRLAVFAGGGRPKRRRTSARARISSRARSWICSPS